MNKVSFFTLIGFVVLLVSCAPSNFYQIYKAIPGEGIIKTGDVMIYEDVNCRIEYNLWADGGNPGFRFFNKTDKNIYLKMDESFYILNGIAQNYFRNRVFTKGKNVGIAGAVSNPVSLESIGLMIEDKYSVSYQEEETVCVPPNTSKVFLEYLINETPFRNCDLYRFPSDKLIATSKFGRENSPFVFGNRISYTIGESEEVMRIQNDFYVSEITNYPENKVIEMRNDEYCGEKSIVKSKYFLKTSPDMFYLNYGTNGSEVKK